MHFVVCLKRVHMLPLLTWSIPTHNACVAQVTWPELFTLVDWALINVSPVNVSQGGSQAFYVDLSAHAYVALRVPQLSLQSYR